MDSFLSEKQKENSKYFFDNLKDFLNNPIYKFKFAVIHEKNIVGIYDTSEAAIENAAAKWPIGEFIIQQIISEDEEINFLFPALGACRAYL